MNMKVTKRKSGIVTYYMAPCFGCGYGHTSYGGYYVGSVNGHFRPWNASSPQAKKEYDKKYKRWGRLVMLNQLAQGDD